MTRGNIISKKNPVITNDVVQYWQQSKPEQRDRPYLHTHANRFAHTINLINELCHPQNVLDVAGNGVSQHLMSKFLSPSSYTLTPKTLDIEIDPWEPHVKHNFYDVVLLTEVIEHMSADPAFVLHQANLSLKEGGLLAITTPNICSYLGVFNLLHGRAPYHWGVLMGSRGDRHHREYAPRELEELTAVNGFSTKLLTLDCYDKGEHGLHAKAWVEQHVLPADPALAGDTIVVLAQKNETLKRPIRIDPVYETSIADPRDAHINQLIDKNCGQEINCRRLANSSANHGMLKRIAKSLT